MLVTHRCVQFGAPPGQDGWEVDLGPHGLQQIWPTNLEPTNLEVVVPRDDRGWPLVGSDVDASSKATTDDASDAGGNVGDVLKPGWKRCGYEACGKIGVAAVFMQCGR